MNNKKISRGENARSIGQKKVLMGLQKKGVCNFCQGPHFLEGHPNPILYKNKCWVVTKNRWPYKGAKSHLLVIYKEHITSLTELSVYEWTQLHKIVSVAVSEMKLSGFTLVVRSGDMSSNGGTIQHLHAQVVSGDGKEPVTTRIG